ncbi:hypothetical protein FNV43_RR05109 [Rhamnella rubrinervis]|uniref:RNase H type-1 domain-containing protein n=1 Tax=Rhamnella rubrinervis TaxID=2594499 RepID=A0A8K0HLH8_9ROSA|nr:hypothetical protein FNV43_RR05109 [Rhamnella rubrinervis]
MHSSALVWALEIAKVKAWTQVCWSSDALNVVKEVEANSEPCCWDTRYLLLLCKSLLKEMNWNLTRNAGSSNTVADAAAKFTLSSNNCILFSFFDLLDPVLPDCIWEAVVQDQLNIGCAL